MLKKLHHLPCRKSYLTSCLMMWFTKLICFVPLSPLFPINWSRDVVLLWFFLARAFHVTSYCTIFKGRIVSGCCTFTDVNLDELVQVCQHDPSITKFLLNFASDRFSSHRWLMLGFVISLRVAQLLLLFFLHSFHVQ